MPIKYFGATDTGKVRALNQDSFLASSELNLFVVADGMGGQAAGEVASSEAVASIADNLKNCENKTNREESFKNAISLANNTIFSQGKDDLSKKGMGTTVVAARVFDEEMMIANVGDSRAYLFRNQILEQITKDHSLMNQQFEAGIIDEEQLKHYPFPNIITRAVGSEPQVEVDIFNQKLQDEDLILLCSDGLTTMVSDEDIGYILMLGENDLEVTTDALIFRANEKGGSDNITVLLILFQKGRPDS